MKVAMPGVDEVEALAPLADLVVPPAWEDLNGHVNVMHYLELSALATGPMLAELGIDEAQVRRQRRGLFDIEHHIWYLHELHVGDRVSLHVRYLARSAKRFHGNLFIVNRTRRRLASVFEFVTTGADLDTRRAAALPAQVIARLDALIAAHGRLGWPAPQSGVLAA